MSTSALGLGIGVILVALIGGMMGLGIGLCIAAAILRGAVSWSNKLMPSDPYSAIPEQPFTKAIGVVLVAGIVQFAVSFAVGSGLSILSGLALSVGSSGRGVSLLAGVISLPIGFLINSSVLAGMLPTTFVKGMLVSLLQYLICLIIGAVCFFGAVMLFGVLAVSLHH